jgi:hypothetical protein
MNERDLPLAGEESYCNKYIICRIGSGSQSGFSIKELSVNPYFEGLRNSLIEPEM